MEDWVAFFILAGFAIYDIRTRTVPVPAVAGAAIAVLIFRLYNGITITELAAGLVPGILLLLLSYATGESIGTGDGLVICVLGLYGGLTKLLAVLGMSFILAALLAMVLLVFRRVGRKSELPFLPCLFCAWLLYLVW